MSTPQIMAVLVGVLMGSLFVSMLMLINIFH